MISIQEQKTVNDSIIRIEKIVAKATEQLRTVEDWLHEVVAVAYVLMRDAESIGYLDAMVTEMRNHSSSTRKMRSNEMRLGYYFFPHPGKYSATSRILFTASLEWLQTRSDVYLMDESSIMRLVRAEGLDAIERGQSDLRTKETAQSRDRHKDSNAAVKNQNENKAAKAAGMSLKEYETYLDYKVKVAELALMAAELPNQPVILRRLIKDDLLQHSKSRNIQDGAFIRSGHKMFRICYSDE